MSHFHSRDNKDSAPHQPLCPTDAFAVTPIAVNAMSQDSEHPRVEPPTHPNPTQVVPSTNVQNALPSGSEGPEQYPRMIFDKSVTLPATEYTLPEPNGRFTSTPQLAYCLSLIQHSLVPTNNSNEIEYKLPQRIPDDKDEQERLKAMSSDLIRAFIQDDLNNESVVAEIVSLSAVLEQDDFKKLLNAFITCIDHSALLDVDLLDGLSQLIRNAPQDNIDSDDLVIILKHLHKRLMNTHKQSAGHTYRLALTISNVLDSMVDSQVGGLSREQLSTPLNDYLDELQKSSDAYLVYQAAYASQALMHINDDGPVLKTALQRTGKVVQGISGVVSAVKGFDLIDVIDGLNNIQQGPTGTDDLAKLTMNTYTNAKRLMESGQGFFQTLQDCFKQKSAWYPALRVLDRSILECRLADFEELARETPCKKDPAFQWGLCQRLGEIAANDVWDDETRKCAIDFLGELYNDGPTWGSHADIKQWTACIISQLIESTKDDISNHVQSLLKELETDGSNEKQELYRQCRNDSTETYPMTFYLPPKESILLDHVQNKPELRSPLLQLKSKRLEDKDTDIYISPKAKSSLRAIETFDLMSKVQEFLQSKKKVFLLLGDSGSGKSTFNRALEINIWEKYGKEDVRIPLFIHLPLIENPERNLVTKQLQRLGFTEIQIKELKEHHEFILICDGYDEIQQTKNLYETNQLNKPGEWQVQMVISCRTEYNGVDYKNRFQPTERNNDGDKDQFQEAIVAPFNEDQIQDYVKQYVSSKNQQNVSSEDTHWELEKYQQALKEIPNLLDLVKNPFLLKIALEVLPGLFNKNSSFSAAHITRVELYDKFVSQWIERSEIRLRGMELSSHDKESFETLCRSGFMFCSISYLKEFATAIYDHQGGNPIVSYLEHRVQEGENWKTKLFNNDGGRKLLREAIPLTCSVDQYRFIHKSILEYGLSLAVCELNKDGENMESASITSRRMNAGSVQSFKGPLLMDDTAIPIKQLLLESPLGRINFVRHPSVLQFLTERAQQQPTFKDQLRSIIEQSKTEGNVEIAAANAITILVRAGVQFNGVNLQGIKIPGADLSYGVFDSAHLEGADLRDTNLRNIWLRQANLRGAQMTRVQFGELPYLQQDSDVKRCAFSPDGKILAVGTESGAIDLYETSDWERIRSLNGHSEGINDIAFSPAGDRIASGSDDKTARVWDVDTGNCIQTFQGHTGQVLVVVYSPKGDQIASGGDYDDTSLRLWDVDTGNCIQTLCGYRTWTLIRNVVYSPKGDQIAYASCDSTVRVWDIDIGNCTRTLEGHTDGIRSVVYSPKGDQIASGGSDNTVRLWDVDAGNCIQTLKGHSNWVDCVVYSPNGDRIASGCWDGTVRVWDVGTGNCIHTLQCTGMINYVAYLPKGDQIVSGGWSKAVQLLDVYTGKCIKNLHGNDETVWSIVYSPQRDQIAYKDEDKKVRLWNVDTGNCIKALQGHTGEVKCVVYSPNGDQIASGHEDKTMRLWDVDTGKCIQTLQGHTGVILGVVYSPKGDRIASGSDDFTVRVWDVDTGNCIKTLQGHTHPVWSVAYSPKGDQIASGGDDFTVRVWDVDTGNCIRTLEVYDGYARSVAYSPKGDQIASGCWDGSVYVWDVDTGNCIRIIEDDTSRDLRVVYSPKGDRIASGCNGKIVRVWDVDTEECIQTLQGHTGEVNCVVYSPKGDQIASGSEDRTVKLWSVDSGLCLFTIPCFNGAVNSISWRDALEGYYLITGSDDKSVRRWHVKEENGEHRVYLCWSSSHEALVVNDASFDGVRGLSQLNRKFLRQCGTLAATFEELAIDS